MLIYVKSKRFTHNLSLDNVTNVIRKNKKKLSGSQPKDLSSGFQTMQDSNQPTQLQRLARMLKFCV